jgi:hypothetical protein
MRRSTLAAAVIPFIATALAMPGASRAQSASAPEKTELEKQAELEERRDAFCDYYEAAIDNGTFFPDDKDLSIPGVSSLYTAAEVVTMKRRCAQIRRQREQRDNANRKVTSSNKWGI